MSATQTPSTRIIDVACVFVVAATIAMYIVTQQTGLDESGARTILAIAVAKSLVISAVFMGLLWSSRLLFAVIATSFILLGFVLTTILM